MAFRFPFSGGLARREGYYCKYARSFDSASQAALVLCADTGLPWWQNLRLARDELLERFGVFVVDVAKVFRAEVAVVRNFSHSLGDRV